MIGDADNEAILERLDLVIALLQIANEDAIQRTRQKVRADPVSAAILEACDNGWTGAAVIRAHVAKSGGDAASRTIQRRLRDLVERGALRDRGATSTKSYRTTGLI